MVLCTYVFYLFIYYILNWYWFFLYFNIYIDYTYEKIQRTCNYELLLLTYHVIFVSLSIKIDFYWNVIYNHNLSNIPTQNIHLAQKITFALFKNQYSNETHLNFEHNLKTNATLHLKHIPITPFSVLSNVYIYTFLIDNFLHSSLS